MPVVDVVNLDGKKVGEVELADAVFGAKVNPHLLHEASLWYMNGLRRGTHKVKEKSEVSGAGRKLWKQKGTGRARVGSIRSLRPAPDTSLFSLTLWVPRRSPFR